MRSYGVGTHSGGGETADVGDLTGTVTVDSCAVVVMDRLQVLDNANIKPGLAIVGLASAGQATYETFENSGIGSNGLTSARHDLLSPYYLKNIQKHATPRRIPLFFTVAPTKWNILYQARV